MIVTKNTSHLIRSKQIITLLSFLSLIAPRRQLPLNNKMFHIPTITPPKPHHMILLLPIFLLRKVKFHSRILMPKPPTKFVWT